ncbi:MAG: uroporphyrinogen-III synthase [Planctomycetes bacterium]|nr:uroporphyrinogen-III synthase [Planctomycetota bacterium]
MTAPLGGRVVLLTRDEGFAEALRARGAEVRVAPLLDFAPVEHAVDPGGFDWIVFTSPRAVAYYRAPLSGGARIACVGRATARAVVARGAEVAVLPAESGGAAALVSELTRREDLRGRRVLFPCGDRALAVVEEGLAAAGARVTRLVVYRAVDAASLPPGIARGVDAVVFASPSAVAVFTALGGDLAAARAVAIGPTTARALAARGIEAAVAPTPDAEGVVAALISMEDR